MEFSVYIFFDHKIQTVSREKYHHLILISVIIGIVAMYDSPCKFYKLILGRYMKKKRKEKRVGKLSTTFKNPNTKYFGSLEIFQKNQFSSTQCNLIDGASGGNEYEDYIINLKFLNSRDRYYQNVV